MPALKKMPTKRGVHLHNLTADALAFTLAFDNAPGGWPCDAYSQDIEHWHCMWPKAEAVAEGCQMPLHC